MDGKRWWLIYSDVLRGFYSDVAARLACYDLVQLKQLRSIKFIQEITAADTNKKCWLLRNTELKLNELNSLALVEQNTICLHREVFNFKYKCSEENLHLSYAQNILQRRVKCSSI